MVSAGSHEAVLLALRGSNHDPLRRPVIAKSVVINPFVDWGTDRPPQHEYADSIIYEAHVKSLRRNGINGVDPSASLRIGTLCAHAAGRRLSSARTRLSVPSEV
jgi:hypothetical protein